MSGQVSSRGWAEEREGGGGCWARREGDWVMESRVLEVVEGSGRVVAKRLTAEEDGESGTGSLGSGSGKVEEGESWISVDQAALRVSMSKPSRRMRILAQESQFGGMSILSRSTMLCLTVSLFRSEWIPREV